VTRTTQSDAIVEFRPVATFIAGVAQIAAGIWFVLLPDAWSIGLFEIALGIAIVVLARRGAVPLLWVTAVAPVLVGGLLVFSGGLFVVVPGIVVIVAIAVDVLIGRLRS